MSNNERKFLTEFIELYKSFPALWRIKGKEYQDLSEKKENYDVLVKKLKEKYADATKELVIRKINSLQASYRREYKKRETYSKAGYIYLPSLWCYNLLSFLEDQQESEVNDNNNKRNITEEKGFAMKYEDAGECEESNKNHLIELRSYKISCYNTDEAYDDETMDNEESDDQQAENYNFPQFYSKNDERKFLRKFIETYRSLPSLWKVDAEEYKNKDRKSQDYQSLVNMLRERYPNATKEMAMKKIKRLRTSYRRSLRKSIASRKSGEIHKPTLWYFNLLSFLENQNEEKIAISKEDEEVENSQSETETKNYIEKAKLYEIQRDDNIDDILEYESETMDNEESDQSFPEDYNSPQFYSKHDERQFLREFIETYRSLPSLWKVDTAEYKNKEIKSQDYVILVNKLKERYPNATKEMAVKKIKRLRASYRRSLRKIIAYRNSGDVHKPTLWYFNLLSFLGNQYEDMKAIIEGNASDDEETISSPQPKKKKFFEESNLFEISSSADNVETYEDDGTETVDNDESDDPLADNSKAPQFYSKNDERKFLREFIELFKTLPSLWNANAKVYKNKEIKSRDYAILLKKLKEKYPDATKELVLKKIKRLRTSYRREINKILSYRELGDIYEPTLWYFNLLSFLGRPTPEIKVIENKTIEEAEEIEIQPKQCKNPDEDKLISLAWQKLAEGRQSTDVVFLAHTWASQYDEMNHQQKLIARKLITDILFQGCLGSLQIDHTVQIQNIFNTTNADKELE